MKTRQCICCSCVLTILLMVTVIAVSGCADSRVRAIAEIERLGGTVKVDEKAPRMPVVGVDLHLSELSNDGLVHLTGLTKLSGLNIRASQVDDAGLAHLEGLIGLKGISLSFTQVTDAGLVHLIGLTELKVLSLRSTQVTDAGVNKLRQALPN